jgi:sulfur carrier protein
MIHVVLAWSPGPRQVEERSLELPEGATVRDALRACPELKLADGEEVGVWGRKTATDAPLRENDRVEIYRGLLVDPKVARRERFRKQGARAAGLFAKRRPGSKPGY